MPRLFVIPSRGAHEAVILRRGPSAWCHVIQWHTLRDTFDHGAWFRGRMYEEKCDLSPDGTLLLYFVHQGNRTGSSYSHAWTGVSRSPFLHALVLWPHGTTYGGGGRFTGDRTVTLRGIPGDPHPDHPLRGLTLASGNVPVHRSSDDVPGSDWCGRDHAGRIVHTRDGQLFARSRSSDVLLADFRDLRPDPQPAPEWATKPLARGTASAPKRETRPRRKR